MKDEQKATEEHVHWSDPMWYAFLTGTPLDMTEFPVMVRVVTGLEKGLLRIMPGNPRCMVCHAPFKGIGGMMLGPMGYSQSDLSPKLCSSCVNMAKKHEGGAEIELSMLFADIRGSTTLAEKIGPGEFQKIINRFYKASSDVIIEANGLVDRLVGDEMIGLFMPGFAGPDHAKVAIDAARKLLEATGHGDPDGPWIKVGAGVHTGLAFVGAVGSPNSLSDITALGDSVNTAARLASNAAVGEVLVSHEALAASGLDLVDLEHRLLDLKGRSQPVDVQVIRVGPAHA